MAKLSSDLRIALFIDFENLVTRTGFTDTSFDLQPALDKLLERGKVVFKRAYCDWSRFPEAKIGLHEKGVELVDVPPSTRTGKNGADMRLVIDAMELAYRHEHVDTFVIASGDSDFCPLAHKLRENNRHVIGLAVKEATSPLFVRACDEFIYLKPKAGRAAKPARAPAPEPTEAAPAKKPRSRRGSTKKETPAPVAPPPPVNQKPAAPATQRKTPAPAAPAPVIQKPAAPANQRKVPVVPQVARDVTASILSRATEPVNPSAIKSAIVRQQPDFDVRHHGFSTFTRLLEALEREGLLKRQETSKGQWNVVPAS